MTVTLENVTRSVDGIPAIRDVSLTLKRGYDCSSAHTAGQCGRRADGPGG